MILLDSAYGDGRLILPSVAFTAIGIGDVARIFYSSKLKQHQRSELGRLAIERNEVTRALEALKHRRPPSMLRRSQGRPTPTVPLRTLAS